MPAGSDFDRALDRRADLNWFRLAERSDAPMTPRGRSCGPISIDEVDDVGVEEVLFDC